MPASFLNSITQSIAVFTDGSCHSQLKKGGWASIIIVDARKVVLEGNALETTHQRMELTAVIKALKHLEQEELMERSITVYSDSQYVVGLMKRRDHLIQSRYRTKKLKVVRNLDLVRELLDFMSMTNIQFVKVKAHQKRSDLETQLNREVDLLSRKNMRNVSAKP